jgi:hypothetical protein
LTRRLRRYKHRIKDYHAGQGNGRGDDATDYVIEAPADDEDAEPTEFTPIIIAETSRRMESLSVSQAVVHLDLTGAPALVFRNAGHGRVNVVYRRPDGHIGWIDVPALAAGAA